MHEDERLMGREFKKDDFDEAGLRPREMGDYIGQEKSRRTFRSLYRLPNREMKPWIMCFYMARPAWEKPRWQVLLPVNWVPT